ncbi:MAG: translation initiation factor IF-2 [Rhodospirillaceae bacterium]|nr:translation initiation factor IF-2 [Rhodospirillaceae bacterium]
MTETTEKNKGSKLSLARPGKLELKKTVDSGSVRQSFSHGRSKMVAVERKTKRTFAIDSGGHMAEVKAAMPSLDEEPIVEDVPAPEPELPPVVDESKPARLLTNEEKAARQRALEEAKKYDEERREAAARDAEQPEADALAKAAEEEAKAAAESVEPESAPEPEPEIVVEAPAADKETPKSRVRPARSKAAEEAEELARARSKKGERRPSAPSRRGEPKRRPGKLTISEALEEQEERQRSVAQYKRKLERERQKSQQSRIDGHSIVREVVVPESITVQELANRMATRTADVIKTLMSMDVMVTATQIIDADTAELVVAEFGHKLKRVSAADVEIGLKGADDNDEDQEARAPVVTVMGHVDHGKTSLLDALRETDVAAHEAGGITQHIGAYQVQISSGEKITFIDTPGHAAFTEMRSRGAQVTDIVVLCVAADDGIMPQTIEAIHHAKAAEVPIIVAINKIDRPDADANRVRTELLQHDVQVEEVGGEVQAIEVSALEKTNLDKLEEAIVLQAELLELKANSDCPAEGVVVESKMEQGRGSVSTVLVQRGTLKVGDILVAGGESGRVRAMHDAHGQSVEEAGPSVPVEVLGLTGTPEAGDEVNVVENDGRAREVSEFRQRRQKDATATAMARGTLEQMFEKIKEGETETLPVVVKSDVHGSMEAICSALEKMSTDEVRVQVLHAAVGGINESDVTLARASNAWIIAFNVRANPQARDMAKRDGVDIRYYSIIYNVTDDLKQALSGMLAPEIRETFLGYADIREVFNVSKVGKVAGCMVTEGQVKRGAAVRLIRDDVVIHEGELSQLKRFKDDAKEVKEGAECGVAFANYQDLQVGDRVECFEVEEVAREL